MIIVHNVILRGVNSIYLQCVNVETRSPGAVPGFVGYARMWASMGGFLRPSGERIWVRMHVLTITTKVHEHHDNEEGLFFPRLEELVGVPGLMTSNVEQHATFHDGLETLQTYLGAVEAGEERFDGKRLRGIIDSFMPELAEHLHDEIKTLLALDKYEEQCDWEGWMHNIALEIVAKMQADPQAQVSSLEPPSCVWPPLTIVALLCTAVPNRSHVHGTPRPRLRRRRISPVAPTALGRENDGRVDLLVETQGLVAVCSV